MRVCRGMVQVIRPDPTVPVAEPLIPLVVSLFDATMTRLGAQDQDQEVKECAIKCIAVAVKYLGDLLPDKVFKSVMIQDQHLALWLLLNLLSKKHCPLLS